MSTWQLLSDAGNAFRWESSGNETHKRTRIDYPHERISNSPPLPSMEDLLFQGSTRIFGGGFESGPMFKTGSGKPVALKQSTLERALSVLGCDDDDDGRSAGCPRNFGSGFEIGPMFKTPVALKQSSLERALSVLGCDDDDGRSAGQFHTRDNGGSFTDSLFQTGSGKRVNISSAGLVRAKTLLGLDETDRLENGQNILTKDESEPLGFESCAESSGVKAAFTSKISLLAQSHSKKETLGALKPFGTCDSSVLKLPPIKFNTAGGRSISVSRDALQRARSLLGDPELGTFPCDEDVVTPLPSNIHEKRSNTLLKSKKITLRHSQNGLTSGKSPSKGFISPLRSLDISKSIGSTNLIKKFDAEYISDGGSCRSKRDVSDMPDSVEKRTHATSKVRENSLMDCSGIGIDSLKRISGGPLVDISNNIGTAQANRNHVTGDKKRLGMNISVSPFKRPRNSRFSAPLSAKFSTVTTGPSCSVHEEPHGEQRISTRDPFRVSKVYVKEFFGLPKLCQETMHHLPEHIRNMTPESAQKYIFFHGSDDGIGIEAFCHLLTQFGGSNQFASKEWVANHYKWTVWKLACYERCYSARCIGKFLTVFNVLDQLKYRLTISSHRYEREVNHGHRSAIKRILEGDASPSSEVVLCVSAIHSEFDPSNGCYGAALNGNENRAAKIEVTDGWYSIDALLDALLTKQLAARRLFIGQKLRILGAQLCGWAGPVSPLEVSRTASLVLHINGTYRAHWADRLGFCKVAGPPLALRCIKSAGGPVPRTLVGVARIYPVLYRERLSIGGSIVRSERMENRMAQLYNQRRSAIVEGVVSDFQRTGKMCTFIDSDSEEGAKIFRQLETAAEPEMLMAEMSSEQLASFTNYQAKLEASFESLGWDI
ncbi:BRCA2 repeat [Dillenia turbinata]|uniref:BRCA2 repeat n=1 Tax=Dillenia turbinata TaxID=194707 RepID=A0AAN8ZMG3_9MAGN